MTSSSMFLTPVMTLEGHEPVTPFKFPDGKMEHTTMNHVSSICYFPDGKQLISGSDDKTARQWDLQAQKEMKEARDVCKQEVCAVGVSRDGRWVVTVTGGSFGSRHGELRVCEVETGIVKSFSEGHTGTTSIDISLDSTLLASASSDGSTVWIKSLETGDLEATIQFQNSFNSCSMGAVRFSQDSKKLAIKSGTAHCLEVWDVQGETCLRRGPMSTTGVMTNAPMFWTTKDKSIVTAFSFNVSGFTSDRDLETIYEFDAATLETVGAPFEGHTSLVTGIALSFDCALLASAANDQTIKLWAFESRQLLASFDVQHPRCIIFSPDSRQLVYTAWAKIHICDVSSDILSGISPVQQQEPSIITSAAGAPHFADLFNSNATPPAVRQRKDADDDLICDEDYVPPSRNSQPLPTGQLTAGEHGSGRWRFCF